MNTTQTFLFTTSINCGGCIATVKPFLDAIETITSWSVDTADLRRILKVETSLESPDQIINAVTKAGYKIELL